MDFLLYLWVKSIVGGIRMGVHPLVHLRRKTPNAVQGHLIQPLRLLVIRLHHDVGNIVVVFTTDKEKGGQQDTQTQKSLATMSKAHP